MLMRPGDLVEIDLLDNVANKVVDVENIFFLDNRFYVTGLP